MLAIKFDHLIYLLGDGERPNLPQHLTYRGLLHGDLGGGQL
jgi:hypothetical protein